MTGRAPSPVSEIQPYFGYVNRAGKQEFRAGRWRETYLRTMLMLTTLRHVLVTPQIPVPRIYSRMRCSPFLYGKVLYGIQYHVI